ncbi:unnamed protein product [Adineta steineri]|uniref:Uncharacterized protein n=1 Tax=Adineta steineri TaxID=433720 RepID=A0A814MVZ3_9BILA|nr:unnamed protein product [Adineta steineri]CAF4015577.1 unnamed protein product [Adineta steineri]
MDIYWICIIVILKTAAKESVSELSNTVGIFHVDINTENNDRIKYQDGEVIIAQNQKKHTHFYFTPFPYLLSEETQCYEDTLNDRIELGLQVELYTPQLIEVVKDYLYRSKSSLCGNTTSSFVCDVSLLPINSIRMVQKDLHSNKIRSKYTLDESWQSTTLLLQSMEFVIYTSNMTVCEQLRKTLTEKCRLSNFEIHYSLNNQKILQRQLEVNAEHVTSTNMYNQIRTQFPEEETILLTEDDFKDLISESMDHITMALRLQEGFDSLQDLVTIEKHLERQLSTQQVSDN